MARHFPSAKGWVALIAVVLILVVDQIIKVEVKTSMYLHESIRVTDWFYITFVENNGMAYGMTFINKLVLTFFRMAAIAVIAVYLYRQVRKNARWVYVVCLALVLAGGGRQPHRLHRLRTGVHGFNVGHHRTFRAMGTGI